MTPDWSATAEAVPYAELGDPQTLNLYAYGRNNPVTLADADGHTPLDWIWEQSGHMMQEVGFGFHLWDGVRKDGPGNLHFRHGFKPQLCFCAGSGPGPESWAPGEPLPPDPSTLGPDWKLNPQHRDPNGEEYINDKTGAKLEWNKGRPHLPGNRAKDHWHYTPPGGTRRDRARHWSPGEAAKRVLVGVGRLAPLLGPVIDSAPEWGPVIIAF